MKKYLYMTLWAITMAAIAPNKTYANVSPCENGKTTVMLSTPFPKPTIGLNADGESYRIYDVRPGEEHMTGWTDNAAVTDDEFRTLWVVATGIRSGHPNTHIGHAIAGAWVGEFSTKSGYLAKYGSKSCEAFARDLRATILASRPVTIDASVSLQTSTIYTLYAITGKAGPMMNWIYGTAVSGVSGWDGNDPFVPPTPPPGACAVSGGGTVDVSDGPRDLTLNVSCTVPGMVTISLVDTTGKGTGSSLTSGNNAVHLTTDGKSLPVSMMVGTTAVKSTNITVTADAGNETGPHVYNGILLVTTE